MDELVAVGLLFDDQEIRLHLGDAAEVDGHNEADDKLWAKALELVDHLSTERVVGVGVGHASMIEHREQPRHQIRGLASVQFDLQQLRQVQLDRQLNPLLEGGDLGLHAIGPDGDLGQLVLSQILHIEILARQPLEIGVVHHHELAVFGLHDVELDPVSSGLGGGLQSRKSVLDTTCNEPTVRDNLGFLGVSQFDHCLVVHDGSSCESHHRGSSRQTPELLAAPSRDVRRLGVGVDGRGMPMIFRQSL